MPKASREEVRCGQGCPPLQWNFGIFYLKWRDWCILRGIFHEMLAGYGDYNTVFADQAYILKVI